MATQQPSTQDNKNTDAVNPADRDFGTMDSDLKKNAASPGKFNQDGRESSEFDIKEEDEENEEYSADTDFDAQEMPSKQANRPEQGSQLNQAKKPDQSRTDMNR